MESIASAMEHPDTAVQPHAGATKKKKHKQKLDVNFQRIPGVKRLVLSEDTQRMIGCMAGEHVTSEKPWTFVDKELVQENLEYHLENSEFLVITQELIKFEGTHMLFGYIPDETREFDEFYVCVTEAATVKVKSIIDKIKMIQEERLNNAINKRVGVWENLGSDLEVEENRLKNTRPLIEVEIESKYPILPFKVHFRSTKAQDMRDGYVELKAPDEAANTIYKKRIHAEIQVTPSVLCNEAQTVCTYPTNAATQYEYNIPENFTVSKESIKGIQQYAETKMDLLCDTIRVNGTIDLYSNDYTNLATAFNEKLKIKTPTTTGYLCFIDKKLIGDRMIAASCWHPILTGIIVLSYVQTASSLYLTTQPIIDEVSQAIHEPNPVLIWSFNDDLKPKLILETPREVFALSFCPYDENLLIGGCSNGQIILWDITNKLNYVEREEIFTPDQVKYREYMKSLMSWEKNIFDLARVRATAVSDLKYCHKGCVNAINWMSPFHTISKTGKIEELPEGKRSIQIITSAEDGTILIWDLLKKPVVEAGGFKAVRKLKRLKKRPSALSCEESPYKQLHLNLKPVYKINLNLLNEGGRSLAISSFYVIYFKIDFSINENVNKKHKISERLRYKPEYFKEDTYPRASFFAGTMEGDFVEGNWEGQEFDSGEVINFEDSQLLSMAKYHDGPVIRVRYSTVTEYFLTVGGKVFAIWHKDFKNRPVVWRLGESLYTDGSWFCFEKVSLYLVRADGKIEEWCLFENSKQAVYMRLMSNGTISNMRTHPRLLKENVFGIGDNRGSFRLFLLSHFPENSIKNRQLAMQHFIMKETDRKLAFLQWQKRWNDRYLAYLKAKAEAEAGQVDNRPVIVEQKPAKVKEKKKIVNISPGLRYLEMVKEEHAAHEQERIKSIILEKKQLNTEELKKQREPLRILEEEEQNKRHKQRTKVKESGKIFQETVTMLFPDIVREKPKPPPDPYKTSILMDYKDNSLERFQGLSFDADNYVEEHPFLYDFNWASVLKTGRVRRSKLNDYEEKITHRLRHLKVKELKEEIERAETVVRMAPKISDTVLESDTMDDVEE